ncbi:hypothetical protein G5S42_41345 [Paraburkholderia sp. JPY169]|uniref:Uncharacterized protein n=1 Tax=Paraburkholderia youngii TaxID=2782701 RepID=A0A7Y6JVK5_9BURK|nr:hypothetical protein [Paraburkholderia youngii]NUX99526.1 hypothetical protein [Paraburkholderia youngii]NUX99742.1 hypothetical protein [Paraburkholderia youngii]NUY05861.1 hypothetical protein [Paraburkholderia youngii]
MSQSYEILRQEALEPGGGGPTLMRGRALFMFKGMAIWMKSVTEAFPFSPLPVARPSGLNLPAGLEQNLVAVVATMAIATAEVMA